MADEPENPKHTEDPPVPAWVIAIVIFAAFWLVGASTGSSSRIVSLQFDIAGMKRQLDRIEAAIPSLSPEQ